MNFPAAFIIMATVLPVMADFRALDSLNDPET